MTTRSLPPLAVLGAVAGLAALPPAPAAAQTVELGETTSPVIAPSCPQGTALSACKILLTKTTAVQAMSDGIINPTRVNQQGWVVSFTVGLSRLVASRTTRASIIKDADARFGGAPSLALTVLAPGPDNTFTVKAESSVFPLTPFLGEVLQQPLAEPPKFTAFTALPVLRGEVIGLTIPTWAPVLSLDLPGTQFAYRQSRRANCNNTASSQTAQTRVGAGAEFGCYYTGTRVEYTATEITDTKVPRSYVGDSSTRP